MPRTLWTGDLDDDCHLERYGFKAHVENLCTGVWWFSVGVGDFPDYQELFNMAEADTPVPLTTGVQARVAAECVIEALQVVFKSHLNRVAAIEERSAALEKHSDELVKRGAALLKRVENLTH